MELDRKMLDRLLRMNDEQLSHLIRQIAAEGGIDPASLGISPDNVQSVRAALGGATEEDIARLNEIYTDYKQNRRSR